MDRIALPNLDGPTLERLDSFAEAFHDLFGRRDQARWLSVYLHGLLDGGERKNVESIARRVNRGACLESANPSQALQHFLSESPWEPGEVLSRYRSTTLRDIIHTGGAWVVQEVCFAKRGRSSVGVQRQWSRHNNRKINCQIAVVVAHLSPQGYWPAAVELYLPKQWILDHAETPAYRVPPAQRAPRGKSEIALGLLRQILQENSPAAPILAEEGFASSEEFLDGVESLNLSLLPTEEFLETTGAVDPLTLAADEFARLQSELGLDHFEGRSWRGWHHHASLVFLAHGFSAGGAFRRRSSMREIPELV